MALRLSAWAKKKKLVAVTCKQVVKRNFCASRVKQENMNNNNNNNNNNMNNYNNNMNNYNNNNNMENWAVSAMRQKPCLLRISYQLNITWLNVIVVKEYLSGFINFLTFMSAFQYAPSNP